MSDSAIYNLISSHILFPMPNNPTYQSIYAEALQEVAIVMFSEAGDLQSNVQSTDADVIFSLSRQADPQLLQTMASYIKEAQEKPIRPFIVRQGSGGGNGDGDGGDDNGDDGWHLDSEDEESEDEADSDAEFKANLKKSLAEQKERHLMRQRSKATTAKVEEDMVYE
jgi:hypothetical protein